MLVLSRRPTEKLILTTSTGERIVVQFVRYKDGHAQIGIDAPASVKVLREELEAKEKSA